MSETKELSESIKKYAIQNEEIKDALKVDGYYGYFGGLDDDIFLLDYWEYEQGVNYLIGISSVRIEEDSDGSAHIKMIHTLNFDMYDAPHILSAFKNTLYRLRRIWDSGGHPKLNPPSYYIEWAISKKHDIPWLAYAIEKGFYVPKWGDTIKQVIEKPEFTSQEILGRREQQHEIILAVIAALEFEPLKIPDGGKAKIKSICLKSVKSFTVDGFGHAWKAGLDKNLFKLENAEKYKP